MTDPRIHDNRVTSRPKATWLLGDDEWGGDKSFLDLLDEGDKSSTALLHEWASIPPVTRPYSPGQVFVILWAGVVIVAALVMFGYLIGSGFIAEMVNR